MPCGVWKVTDIPENKVGRVMAGYRISKPNSVIKEQQPDGLWTVTATFDPCPPGQPQEKARAHKATA